MKLKKSIEFFLILILIISIVYFNKEYFNEDINDLFEVVDKTENNVRLEDEYNECLAKPYDESELTTELSTAISSLDNYLKQNYNLGIVYEDITTGFTYSYNANTVFYGASLIKIVEALYLYEQASIGNLNLDDKITYLKTDYFFPALGMQKYKTGDSIPLREIISYALLYSDNASHKIMQRIATLNGLKNYINDLGASIRFEDSFGNLSAKDTNIILKHLYEFIENNKEFTEDLLSWLINEDESYMINNKVAAHKYGQHDKYFHDIALVYESNPYALSILTHHGQGKYGTVIYNVSRKVLELHNLFHETRTNTCQQLVYE